MGVIRKTEQAGPPCRRLGRSSTPAGWSRPEIPDWLPRVLSLCLLLVCPRPSAAADKVDVITFKNGDRITCEIKKLDRGTLKVSTDPLGTVNVHWGEVAAMASPREFEVQVSSGDQYFGVIAVGGTRPGDGVVPGTDITLDLADVIRLTPIGSTFWTRIDGSVDAGFSFAQANTETHLTANASTSYRGRQLHDGGDLFGSNVTTREDADRTFRSNFNLNGSRFFDDRWFTLGWGVVEQNDELSLDLRLLGAAASDATSFTRITGCGRCSPAWRTRTSSSAANPPTSPLEAALGGQLDFFTPMNDDFDITNRIIAYFRLGGRSRVRLDFQSSLPSRALQRLLLEPERLRHLRRRSAGRREEERLRGQLHARLQVLTCRCVTRPSCA